MCECKGEMTREELNDFNDELLTELSDLREEEERKGKVILDLISTFKDVFGKEYEDFHKPFEMGTFLKKKIKDYEEHIKCLQEELVMINKALKDCKAENEKLKSKLHSQNNDEQSHENELRTALLVVIDELARLRKQKGL